MQQIHTGKKDLIDITFDSSEKIIKIVGFKHNEIKAELSNLLEKVKTYNLPKSWDFCTELLY